MSLACPTRTVCVVRTWRLKLKSIMFLWISLCTCWPPSSGNQLLSLFSVMRCVVWLCIRGGQSVILVSPGFIWQLLLLKKLQFHLTVHSPFRPLEGFIIDIKVHRVHTHTCTHMHTHTHTCTHTHARTHTHTHMHTHAHTHACTHTHAQAHARTHTHTHAHTRTGTRTHTLIALLSSLQTRSPGIVNPDQFRKAADSFLVKSLSSDVGLLYPPSQVSHRC